MLSTALRKQLDFCIAFMFRGDLSRTLLNIAYVSELWMFVGCSTSVEHSETCQNPSQNISQQFCNPPCLNIAAPFFSKGGGGEGRSDPRFDVAFLHLVDSWPR